MNVRIYPHELSGTVRAIASKSVAHRTLIMAALADGPCDVDCLTSSADIDATVSCLEALGAQVTRTKLGFRVIPLTRGNISHEVTLDCGESGSTLRFLLPVVAALGVPARFLMRGRLSERPLSPLDQQLAEHGVTIERAGDQLVMAGQLTPGRFLLPGDVSSQFASGLLMASTLLDAPSEVCLRKPVESRPYVELTERTIETFGVDVKVGSAHIDATPHERFSLRGGHIGSPGDVQVEGDWSNAAFWLAAGALGGSGVSVMGLDALSPQGDRQVLAALAILGARISRSRASAAAKCDDLLGCRLDMGATPDLVPALAAVAAYAEGDTYLGSVARLRLKESDRLETVCAALTAMGGSALALDDVLIIHGGTLTGGTVHAANDHRIAMMAAIAATRAEGPTTIIGAECVSKSYPHFFDDFASLNGSFEILED